MNPIPHPWFRNLDPDTADMLADYLVSKEALDTIAQIFEESVYLMFVPYDPKFEGQHMLDFIEEHRGECMDVARRATVQSYFRFIEELRNTRTYSKLVKTREKEEDE